MLGMLPQNKKISTVLLEGSDGKQSRAPEVQEDNSVASDSVAAKLLQAIESKDKAMLMDALRDAFTMIESEVDEPGEVDGDAG